MLANKFITDINFKVEPSVTRLGSFDDPKVLSRCPLPLVEPTEGGWFSHSRGTLVWFQENFAFPIDPEVMAQIRALDWNTVAVDSSD